MTRLLLITILLLLSFDGKANNQALLKKLDKTLDMRQQYDAAKEKRIAILKDEST